MIYCMHYVEEEDAFDNWDENPFEKERQKKKEALIKEAKSLARELKGKDKKKVNLYSRELLGRNGVFFINFPYILPELPKNVFT